MTLLKVDHLTKNFGGLSAVSNVNLSLEKNELVGLIGPNGAGKTTLFNLLTGVYEPSEGEIRLEKDGKSELLNKLAPYKIATLGLSRTFQNIRLFKELTVMDLSLIHISEPTRRTPISYAVFCLKKKKIQKKKQNDNNKKKKNNNLIKSP